MKVKYFGAVKAEILDDDRRIELSFMVPGKQPLDANHPQRCLRWAVSALQPYIDKGYVFAGPEVSASG